MHRVVNSSRGHFKSRRRRGKLRAESRNNLRRSSASVVSEFLHPWLATGQPQLRLDAQRPANEPWSSGLRAIRRATYQPDDSSTTQIGVVGATLPRRGPVNTFQTKVLIVLCRRSKVLACPLTAWHRFSTRATFAIWPAGSAASTMTRTMERMLNSASLRQFKIRGVPVRCVEKHTKHASDCKAAGSPRCDLQRSGATYGWCRQDCM